MAVIKSILGSIFGVGSEWFWAMVQFLVVTVSLCLIYRQLRLQSTANMISSLHSFDERWRSDQMINARKAVCSRYEMRNLHIRTEEEAVAGFFEDLGIYLRRKIFDISIVWETYSYYIEHYWCLLEPNIKEFRATDHDESWFSNFEDLYQKTMDCAKKKKLSCTAKSSDQLKKFIRGELEMIQKGKPPSEDKVANSDS